MSRFIPAGFFMLSLLAPLPVLAAGELDVISDLLASGQYDEARALALENRAALEGDPDFDYLYAVASVETAHYHEAVFAFERVLLLEPENLQARLGLAKACYHLGDFHCARLQFDLVKRSGPPARVAEVVEAYLGKMGGRELSGAVVSAYAELSLGHDSNVNGATSDQTFTPALGAPVRIGAAGRKSSDMYRSLELGATYLRALKDDLGLEVRASISDQDYFSGDSYDQDALDISATLVYERNDHLFSGSAGFRKTDLDGRDYQEVRSLSASWVKSLDDDWRYQLGVTLNDVKYPDARFRDQQQQVYFTGLQGAFTAFSIGAGLVAGLEDADKRAGERWARDYVGYYLNAGYQLDDRHRLYGRWYSHKAVYDAPMPLFRKRRDEVYDNLLLGLACQVDEQLSLKVEYTLSDNDSNIGLFGYDRQVLQTSVRYQF